MEDILRKFAKFSQAPSINYQQRNYMFANNPENAVSTLIDEVDTNRYTATSCSCGLHSITLYFSKKSYQFSNIIT
jgi:hypothetical protein